MLLLNLYPAVAFDGDDAWPATKTQTVLIRLPNSRHWAHLVFLHLLRSWFDVHFVAKY